MIEKREAIVLTDIAELQYRNSMEGKIEEFCDGFVSSQIVLAAKDRNRSVLIEVPKELDYFKVRAHIQFKGGFIIPCTNNMVSARMLEIRW